MCHLKEILEWKLFFFLVCAFWMLFGGTKYTEDYDGNVNDTLSVEGFEDFGVALFTLFRMTLVDDYPYDVSNVFVTITSVLNGK